MSSYSASIFSTHSEKGFLSSEVSIKKASSSGVSVNSSLCDILLPPLAYLYIIVLWRKYYKTNMFYSSFSIFATVRNQNKSKDEVNDCIASSGIADSPLPFL